MPDSWWIQKIFNDSNSVIIDLQILYQELKQHSSNLNISKWES
jgi:hypothetical protein